MDGEELQRALLRAARLFDPLGAALLDDAAGAHATRIPGAGIAEVTFDSRGAPSQVRGGARVRLLTFEAAGMSVDVEVTPGLAGDVLVGRLTPAAHARVTVRGRRPVTTTADALGRFGFPGLPRGPFSLLIELPGVYVTTDWIAL